MVPWERWCRDDTRVGPFTFFFRMSFRTLALNYNPTARLPNATETRMLARALARVVAHEIVHSVAPDAPHSQSGLMQQKLMKTDLTAPHLGLSPPSTEDLRSGLQQSSLAAMK